MKIRLIAVKYFILFVCFSDAVSLCAQINSLEKPALEFNNFPFIEKSWVSWHWMQGAVSKQGITADLEAMQKAGISGAWLMPVKDTSAAITIQTTDKQATSQWFTMVSFAMQEAKRLNLQLAMHVSDGFALSGNTWIKPEMAVQKLVWTKDYVKNGDASEQKLEQPEAVNGYYKDIAVYAYPANSRQAFSDTVQVPSIATSNGANANFLCFDTDNKEIFKSNSACWIQYRYSNYFTCRSVRIRTSGNNYSAQRLVIQACNDGMHFRTIVKLSTSQTGLFNACEDYNYSIPVTTARYFRFVYNKEDAEAGSEKKEVIKEKPLQLTGIYMSDEPVINQYEAKNGSVFRETAAITQTTAEENAIPLKNIINLTGKMDSDGKLHWTPPAGNWVILRIGNTCVDESGKDPECDMFNTAVVKLQFNNWVDKAFGQTNKKLIQQILKIFYTDNRESINQNWSNVFAAEFKKRRGYDLLAYLPAMTGVPVESAAESERFLKDIRVTIEELVNDNFYATLKKAAHKKGFSFIEEPLPSAMPMDGKLHYQSRQLSGR